MEDIQKAVRACLTKYADFSGRAARPEFWWFILAQVVVGLVINIVPFIGQVLGLLFSLAMIVPSLAAGARRLHDIGKTGWLQLIALIPLVGWILLIYWYVQPGNPASNQFGPPPADAPPALEAAPGQQ
jgi:uncharacterized membrane protein YhaH (DUF805 family)